MDVGHGAAASVFFRGRLRAGFAPGILERLPANSVNPDLASTNSATLVDSTTIITRAASLLRTTFSTVTAHLRRPNDFVRATMAVDLFDDAHVMHWRHFYNDTGDGLG